MVPKKPDVSKKITALRKQAEARLRTTKQEVAALPIKDVQQLVQELQVHQIELEMQNDELRRTEVELEATRDRYIDLYDFSPTGYLTLDLQGKIVEANLRAGTLLGAPRKNLIGKPLVWFIAPANADMFHRYCQGVIQTDMRQDCEVPLQERTGVPRWVSFESLAIHDEGGKITGWRAAFQDISDRKRAEAKLESERVQREAIIGSMTDAIITVDERKCVKSFNHAAEAMFLCPSAVAVGQSLDRFIPERFKLGDPSRFSFFSQSKATFPAIGQIATLVGLRANGEEFPFEASISYSVVEGQSLFTAIVRDISERKKAEELLLTNEKFIRSVVNSISSHICVLNSEGIILRTNDAWKGLALEHADRVFAMGEIGQNYVDLCRGTTVASTSTGQALLQGLETVLKGEVPLFSAEYCAELPDERRWFLMRVTPLRGGSGAVLTHMDISSRVWMEMALEKHVLLLGEKKEELESLMGKLIEAQELERKRIARDLHDDFNQRLAAMALELETVERAPSAPPERIARQLAAIRGQVGQLSDDLHDLAYRLHPSLLDHVGLELAVRDHVEEFAKRTKVSTIFSARKMPEALSPEIATALFRVMQESLQNVFKHAAATNVTVRLFGSSKGIGLSVRDNGKGFEMGVHRVQHAGLGLVSMHERARQLGGLLRIHSHPGQGAKVIARIPTS